jgi:hypothetical protein
MKAANLLLYSSIVAMSFSTSAITVNDGRPLYAANDPSLLSLAAAAERADGSNWIDDFVAAPPHVKEALGLGSGWNSLNPSIAMVKSHIPFFHFNIASTIGIDSEAASEDVLDSIREFYGPGKAHHIMVAEKIKGDECDDDDGVADSSLCAKQHRIHEQLSSRGYKRYLPFDRVILQDPSADLISTWLTLGKESELVTKDIMKEWSAFLTGYYKMPDIIGEWLRELVGRPGWYHAVLKREGKVVMARSLFASEGGGWGWLGIDAPVPGWSSPTDCYDDDLAVCARLLLAASRGSNGGVKNFVSDVEVPSDERSGPDYNKWRKLGFIVPYRRVVYKWEAT